MTRKKNIIAAIAAVLVFLMPLVSMAQVFTLSEEDENGRLSADGGIGWGPGPIADVDTNEYLPLGNGIWVLAASAGLYLLVKSKKSRRTKNLMFAALVLTLGTTQCHKPTETLSESENETPATKTIRISLTCGNGFYPKADINVNSGSYTWNTGDNVYVVHDGHLLSATPLTVTPNATNPVFGTVDGSIDVTTEIGDNPKFTFYYVGSGVNFTPEENAASLTFDISDQTSGKDVGEYMIGRTKAIQMKKDSEGTKYVADESVVFKPISSVLRLKTTDFGECQMSATGNQAMNQMVIDLGDPSTLNCSHTDDIIFPSGADVSISVMPTTLGGKDNDATVVFTGNDKEGSMTVKNGIKSGVIYAKIIDNISNPYSVAPETSSVIGDVNADPFNGNNWENTCLTGEFTVQDPDDTPNSGDEVKVRFSRGNLYYAGATYKFEKYQYDFRTRDGKQSCIDGVSGNTPLGHCGLFAFNQTRSDFLFTNNGATTPNPDFEVNGEKGMWRALSKDEWTHLLSSRHDVNRYAKARVNGVAGLVLFPDGYSGIVSGTGFATNVNSFNVNFPSNSIVSEDWAAMEAAGVVFLPVTGGYDGSGFITYLGGCWMSNPDTSSKAWVLSFYNNMGGPSSIAQSYLRSIRLVR